MKRIVLFLSLLCVGAAVAASLPDYPVVYSPAVGGPVQNPAYATSAPPAVPTAIPAPPEALPPAEQTMLPPVPPMPRYRRPSSYEVNASAIYGFKATPDSFFACDMAGVEIEGAYYFARHHAVTLSLGFMGGGHTDDYWVQDGKGGYAPFTDSYDRMSFTLMAGYRYSHRIGRYVVLQVGAKCGMDVQVLDIDYGYGWSDYPYGWRDDWGPNQTDNAVGFGYAGYAHIGIMLTPRVALYAGYQFRGSTTRPKADYEIPDWPVEKVGTMRWHEIRLGVLFRF